MTFMMLLLSANAAPGPKRLKRSNAFHEGLLRDWRASLMKRKSTEFVLEAKMVLLTLPGPGVASSSPTLSERKGALDHKST
jgi:hypothetical protein